MNHQLLCSVIQILSIAVMRISTGVAACGLAASDLAANAGTLKCVGIAFTNHAVHKVNKNYRYKLRTKI